ncbi:MAG: adenylate cyclase [Clostridia bacterium]|nr:adenylate cyclase [Clostridia bacterium]
MSEIKETTLRLDLDKESDRKTWDYLQNRDKDKYKSYSKTVVIAVNEYFERQERLQNDPYLETREKEDAFLREVMNTIRSTLSGYSAIGGLLQLLQQSAPQAPPPAANTEEDISTALDFAGSF